MNQRTAPPLVESKGSSLRAGVRRRMMQVGVSLLVEASALFLSAGRLRWGAGWAFVAHYLGVVGVNSVTLLRRDPELIAERSRLLANTKAFDLVLAPFLVLSTLGTVVAAGLDNRFRWTGRLPRAVAVAGNLLMAAGYGLTSWAMASNRYFSTAVRIQKERGQVVETGGPYSMVRHPGYVGAVASNLATPLLLGSRWALIPAGIAAALYVVRTVLEDRTLRRELEGYEGYARRVRYRLIPGVW